MESEDFAAAVAAYETALKLEPRMVPVMVNLSMAYSNLNQNDKAEAWLRRALQGEPESLRPTSTWDCCWRRRNISTRPRRLCGAR